MERSQLNVFSFSYNICKEILCICWSTTQPIKKTKQARVGIFFDTHTVIYMHLDRGDTQNNWSTNLILLSSCKCTGGSDVHTYAKGWNVYLKISMTCG